MTENTAAPQMIVIEFMFSIRFFVVFIMPPPFFVYLMYTVYKQQRDLAIRIIVEYY